VFLPGEPVVIEGSASDDFSGLLTVQAKIFLLNDEVVNPDGWNATCDGGCAGKLRSDWRIDLTSLDPGYYVAQIKAWDRATNQQITAATITFLKF